MTKRLNSFVSTLPRKRSVIGVAMLLTGLIGLVVPSDHVSAASCVDSIYKQGSRSTCVKYTQQIVNASGTSSKIDTDGIFGAKTKDAVVSFQKAKKLTADGIVGANTWKKLCAVTQSAANTPQKNAGCGGSASTTKKGWTTVVNNRGIVVKACFNPDYSQKIQLTRTASGGSWYGVRIGEAWFADARKDVVSTKNTNTVTKAGHTSYSAAHVWETRGSAYFAGDYEVSRSSLLMCP